MPQALAVNIAESPREPGAHHAHFGLQAIHGCEHREADAIQRRQDPDNKDRLDQSYLKILGRRVQ